MLFRADTGAEQLAGIHAQPILLIFFAYKYQLKFGVAEKLDLVNAFLLIVIATCAHFHCMSYS